jgi:hypothetical protein
MWGPAVKRLTFGGDAYLVMSFFDGTFVEAEFAPPEPRRRRWRGDSNDTLGIPVPFADFLVHNDDLAIMVTGLVAFPAGFLVNIVSISRFERPKGPVHMIGHGAGARPRDAERGLRFGMAFSDGTKLPAHLLRPAGTPGQPMLQPRGGRGGGRRFAQGYWCQPLPPPGPVRFVCRWLDQGIEEVALVLEARDILDAAAHATTIWPDDMDLPEEDHDEGENLGGSFSSYPVPAKRSQRPDQ